MTFLRSGDGAAVEREVYSKREGEGGGGWQSACAAKLNGAGSVNWFAVAAVGVVDV